MEQKKGKVKLEDIFTSKGIAKILRILSIEKEINITKISEITKLNHANVSKHLDKLERFEIVERKQFGNIKIYRLKLEDQRVKMIKHLFDVWEYVPERKEEPKERDGRYKTSGKVGK